MPTQSQPITNTPLEIVAAMSLVVGTSYRITSTGTVTIGEGTTNTPPTVGHPLYPSTRRAKHDTFLEVAAGVGIWVWAARNCSIVVTEAQ